MKVYLVQIIIFYCRVISDAQVVTLNDEDTPHDMVAIINMKKEKITPRPFFKTQRKLLFAWPECQWDVTCCQQFQRLWQAQVSRPRICPSWLISAEDEFKRAPVNRIRHSPYPIIGRDAEISLNLTPEIVRRFVPTTFWETIELS